MFTDIRIDGESVDLGEEVKIPLSLQNPHLSYESIPNSESSIPILPFSLRNQRIFQFFEMPQVEISEGWTTQFRGRLTIGRLSLAIC